MRALTRAELLKLRTTRILGWTLAGTLAMVLVWEHWTRIAERMR